MYQRFANFGILILTGNRVVVKSGTRVRIPPTAPENSCPTDRSFLLPLQKARISKGPSPKAKISANISKNPANEKEPNQSKCLLTIQLLLASTKPANACGVRVCGTPGQTLTGGLPLRSYNIRVVPCGTPCFKMSANPHEHRLFYRTACQGVFGSIA